MGLFSSLFAKTTEAPAKANTMLDAIAYLAGLASNPQAIDPALDKVRTITATLQPGQPPSGQQLQVLLGVYLEIEHYLTTKEPLRTYTKEVLRNHLDTTIQQQLTSFETHK